MYTPQTIVIIGIEEKGKAIAHALSEGNNRVLLCDHDCESARQFAEGLQEKHPFYDVEAMDCSYDATWEADLIILNLPCTSLPEAAGRIKEVANQKIIVVMEDSVQALKNLLPNSKIVQAFTNLKEASFYLSFEEKQAVDCLIATEDAAAADTVKALIRTMGFNPVDSFKVSANKAA